MSDMPIVRQASRDLRLGRLAIAVFDLLRDRLDVVEFRPVKLAELEEMTQRSRPQVHGAMKELTACGYLERGARAYARGPITYRLRYSLGAQQVGRASGERKGYGMVSKGVDW